MNVSVIAVVAAVYVHQVDRVGAAEQHKFLYRVQALEYMQHCGLAAVRLCACCVLYGGIRSVSVCVYYGSWCVCCLLDVQGFW